MSALDEYLVVSSRGLELFIQNSIARTLENYQCQVCLAFPDTDDKQELLAELARANVKKWTQKRSKANDCQDVFLRAGVVPGRNRHIGFHNDVILTSCAGSAEGTVLLKLSTDAPPIQVMSIRTIGLILAYIHHDLEPVDENNVAQCLDDATAFDKAFQLWHHVRTTCWPKLWPNRCPESSALLARPLKEEPYSFRASCLRPQSQWSRESIMKHIGGAVAKLCPKWRVDLCHYDVEVVLLIYDTGVAARLSLIPLGKRHFSCHKVPPDMTPPYVAEGLANVVTLRPSTAALLLEMAQLEESDVVMDMCAGIGTIPFEAAHSYSVVSFGGDVSAALQMHMMEYKRRMRAHSSSCADVMLWDATLLPLRDPCVDVVITDLPFGQKCLSTNEVQMMLPLLFSELARILMPTRGRCVLLCGSMKPVVEALWHSNMFLPPSSIIPVNIGGFAAWAILCHRNASPWQPLVRHRERVQKLARRRAQKKL